MDATSASVERRSALTAEELAAEKDNEEMEAAREEELVRMVSPGRGRVERAWGIGPSRPFPCGG